MLCEKYTINDIETQIKACAQRKPFPLASDRSAWNTLCAQPRNAQRKVSLIAKAEEMLLVPWQTLPVTGYFDYIRKGTTEVFEQVYRARRDALGTLVFAECMEGEGRFVDEIVTGIWLLCEETSWALPAEVERKEYVAGADMIPDIGTQTVAFSSCETAALLAEIAYLLKEQLDTVSPLIFERIVTEIETRIFVPVEIRNDFMWQQGYNHVTPSCCNALLGAAIYLMNDTYRLATFSHKLMGYVDLFIGRHGDEGGGHEGASSWDVTAGALLEFLEHLYSATNGGITLYNEPRIKKMGAYIVNAHLDGMYYSNFGDSTARIVLKNAVVYRYGERTLNVSMKHLALSAVEREELLPHGKLMGDLVSMLKELWWMPADSIAEKEVVVKDVWLSGIQEMIVREDETPGKGLVLAAKAGNNNEYHNHNDVGQFIIMHNAEPMIIDIGAGTSSKGALRNETCENVWYMAGAGHNIPVINGHQQAHGKQYTSREVLYTESGNARILQMDMAPAYPEEVGLEQATRTLLFDPRKKMIHIADYIDIGAGGDSLSIALTLYSPQKCRVTTPGCILLGDALTLTFSEIIFNAEVCVVALEDKALRAAWGDTLHKITLTALVQEYDIAYALQFMAQ